MSSNQSEPQQMQEMSQPLTESQSISLLKHV